jgi:hypothetical protein
VEEGSLGLKFVGNSHANTVQIRAVNPGTQAEAHAVLCPGLVLKTVGDTSVEGMAYEDTISVIKAQGRPLTCVFGPVQPLPEAIDASVAGTAARVLPADAPEEAVRASNNAPFGETVGTKQKEVAEVESQREVSPGSSFIEAPPDDAAPTDIASIKSVVPSDLSRSELIKMAESVGFDEELLQDMIDGNDGDVPAVAAMLLEHGAVCIWQWALLAALCPADSSFARNPLMCSCPTFISHSCVRFVRCRFCPRLCWQGTLRRQKLSCFQWRNR